MIVLHSNFGLCFLAWNRLLLNIFTSMNTKKTIPLTNKVPESACFFKHSHLHFICIFTILLNK